MLQGWVILLCSFVYLGVLFAIASYGDRRASIGRSIIANPYIYALSMAVYATTWTYYGSVGRAAASGVGFLPIYIGPTLVAGLWWLVLRKMIRISKANRITSIADFIASINVFGDTALYVALFMAAFTVLFGTRHLDATERHEGMVAAIAFESLVKLLAFLAVGMFVTFGMHGGFGELIAQASRLAGSEKLLVLGGSSGTYGSWASLIFLSMLS